MRLVLVAMIWSILSILIFKYADHTIGSDIFMDDAQRAAVQVSLIELHTVLEN